MEADSDARTANPSEQQPSPVNASEDPLPRAAAQTEEETTECDEPEKQEAIVPDLEVLRRTPHAPLYRPSSAEIIAIIDGFDDDFKVRDCSTRSSNVLRKKMATSQQKTMQGIYFLILFSHTCNFQGSEDTPGDHQEEASELEQEESIAEDATVDLLQQAHEVAPS